VEFRQCKTGVQDACTDTATKNQPQVWKEMAIPFEPTMRDKYTEWVKSEKKVRKATGYLFSTHPSVTP